MIAIVFYSSSTPLVQHNYIDPVQHYYIIDQGSIPSIYISIHEAVYSILH